MSQDLQVRNIPTIFGDVVENNVSFAIDTSGSMYMVLESVKEHLIETLLKHAQRENTMFNVIEFNSEVTQWADKMVKCTPQTLAVAVSWIKKLTAKTGTNTEEALITCFTDPDCEAVYVVTDGLPDQYAGDILDSVIHASQNRAVHCIYLTGDSGDEAATEFLEELAMETYGSFHIVTVTKHGSIERISPIYQADHAQEKMIRTTNGNIYPRVKTCSISSTLNADPADSVLISPQMYMDQDAVLPAAYHGFPYSSYSWTRYRPARAWLKANEKLHKTPPFNDDRTASPSAGALLIDKKVLVRRKEDGYYYMGTVKSQLEGERFLVEIGPCKQGKYKDSLFQETNVYDIVSHADAMRHPVIPGDRVLAPMGPGKEKYAPGIVIEGQERRGAEGSQEDTSVTVAFHTGRTEKVKHGKAVWVPLALYERIEFELRLPGKVRKSLETHDDYPEESMPGYPSSAPERDPPDYEIIQPVVPHPSAFYVGHWPGWMYPRPNFLPPYPYFYKYRQENDRKQPASSVRSEDMDRLIPGTDMTNSALNSKVLSQLMEHKMLLEEQRRIKGQKKILKRRGTKLNNSLKKSVEFKLDDDQNLEFSEPEFDDFEEYEYGRDSYLEDIDSGNFTYTATNDSGCSDIDLDWDEEYLEDASTHTPRDIDAYTDRGKQKKSSKHRPPWKYWKQESSPAMHGGHKPGPYRETLQAAPLEVRESTGEWSSSSFQYVNHSGRDNLDREKYRLLSKTPRPPSAKPQKQQGPGKDFNVTLGLPQKTKENKDNSRREFRRQTQLRRSAEWHGKTMDNERMKALTQDNHREKILAQLQFEKKRQDKEHNTIAQMREAKKQITAEIRSQIVSNQISHDSKEQQRVASLQAKRAQREMMAIQRQQEAHKEVAKKQALREERVQQRWTEVHQRHAAEESAERNEIQRKQLAKINRQEGFHRREDKAQRAKELKAVVNEQNQSILRSQIFP